MGEILNQLYSNMIATSWLEAAAVIFGILSVWFARKENIWVYPTGIVNVLIYVYLCFFAGLYADMAINGFYFVMSVFGWYNWTRRDELQNHKPISALSLKEWVFYLIIVIVSFGLRNMAGNVAEFCFDFYSSDIYKTDSATVINPTGPSGGAEHVIRGGSFKSDAKDVRSAARDFTKNKSWLVTDPQMPKSIWWYSDCIDVGFRVVCEADSLTEKQK